MAVAPLSAAAQTQEDADKGYLTTLIEDSLSGSARDVSIIGFEGALSSAASINVLTVSDEDGVWLTLEGLVLDWNRSALLRGRIDVETLRAERIIVARPPISQATAPSPESSAFALPELPVGIALDQLMIEELTLGPAFLGEELQLTISGSAALSGGEGTANLTATRLGPKEGTFVIEGGYSNITRELALNLDVNEDAGGIAATLLDLPGRPSVGLTIAGTAPIDDYRADIAVATDGQDRIAGAFELTRDANGQLIQLDIGGDVTPLFAPEYQDFFGDDVSLSVLARTDQGGAIDLENLDLQSKALKLSGTAKIGSQGWPQKLSLSGRIANDDASIVLLPLTGPKTYVDLATFNLGYDAAVSPDWSTQTTLVGFDRPGLYLRDLTLSGGGIIISGEGDAVGEVTADLRYAADGLALDDAGASDAFGDKISGVIQMARTEGSALDITRLTLDGPGLELLADATIEGPAEGLRTQSNIVLTAEALDRFSTLAGRDLAGSGSFAIASTIIPLEGAFNALLTGETQDLAIGIDQFDNVFAGQGTVTAVANRDSTGTRLETLRIATPVAELTANADLTTDGSKATFAFETSDLSLIETTLGGAAQFSGTLVQDENGVADIVLDGTARATSLAVTANINPTDAGRTVNASAKSAISDLSVYAALSGQQLSGAATVTADGVLLGDGMRFDADISAQTTDVATGVTQLDPLLRGNGTLDVSVARTGEDRFKLSDLRLVTDAATITGDASGGLEGEATAKFTASIPDARVLGQGLNGPVTANISADRDALNAAQIDMQIDGPGTNIGLDATIGPDNVADGVLTANISNLATYQALIGQNVGGGLQASVRGKVALDFETFDLGIDATTSDLRIGNATVDPLLRGTGQLAAQVALDDGQLTVDNASATTANITLSGNLGGQSGAGRGAFEARLRDVAILTDQLSGPVTANGTAARDQAGNWNVTAQADGPGGITLRTDGQINGGGTVNLRANGRAPLGIANAAIEPRRISGDAVFDIAINGQPQLSSVSGRVDLVDARLTAPTLSQGLSNITGGVSLANGRAQIGINGDVPSGGRIAINGPVALDPPMIADLSLALNDVVIKDPELYQTTISGGLSVTGPLQGSARIGGELTLGQTDIQVPSSGIGALGDLPDVVHFGASTAVRSTLSRAGIEQGTSQSDLQSNGPSFPLDITVNAPSRIFVRGRGLDAELGGSLRIRGTTADIVPVGLFELVRGRIDILQQRFELTEGSASLQGDFEPFIRLVATTQSRTGTTISIIVEGPATEPEVSFVSVPDLPQDEVLSQLIFGRDLQSISPLQAVQLAAAVGTLAGRGGGGLIDNFRQGIGLDDFDITTDEDGNAAVRAGKYLSENVYTDVTVSSDGSTEINLNLDITDEITAKGTVDADGETSIGIFFERDY